MVTCSKKSKVYFTDMNTDVDMGLLEKTEAVLKAAGFDGLGLKGKMTALKVHFGEPGNLAFLRHNYTAKIAKMVKDAGGVPFATDANTLYKGCRSHAPEHLEAAAFNGYTMLTLGCPVIIADGLRGMDYRDIPVNGKHCRCAKIASAIAEADAIISINHVKGHEQTGIAGALKNLGMGSGAREGKLFMHSDSKPRMDADACVGCGACAAHCAHDAISMASGKAEINYDKCVGCGQCVVSCNFDAVNIVWEHKGTAIEERIAEYAAAVVAGKPAIHINFIMDVSPYCDCWSFNHPPVSPDIGIMASTDPVALDMASYHMLINAPCLDGSLAEGAPNGGVGTDPFKIIFPTIESLPSFVHAQAIGLGNMEYELITI